MIRYIFIGFVLLAVFSCKEIDSPITEPSNIKIEAGACLDELKDDELDIVTWNLQKFPLLSHSPQYVDDIIIQMDADIIAVQEIGSAFALEEVLAYIRETGWKGRLHGSGDLKLGFLYNSNKVELSTLKIEFDDDKDAFPRPVIKTKVTPNPEIFGDTTELFLLNVHLKCCEGEENENRRRKAMSRIKSYVDGFHPDDMVVITGDFNDVLDAPEANNIFTSFLNDSPNYSIADLDIATGNNLFWSYPSFPSHLDHFIISNELFSNVENVKTIIIEDCVPDYDEVVSDHRPVLLSLDL